MPAPAWEPALGLSLSSRPSLGLAASLSGFPVLLPPSREAALEMWALGAQHGEAPGELRSHVKTPDHLCPEPGQMLSLNCALNHAAMAPALLINANCKCQHWERVRLSQSSIFPACLSELLVQTTPGAAVAVRSRPPACTAIGATGRRNAPAMQRAERPKDSSRQGPAPQTGTFTWLASPEGLLSEHGGGCRRRDGSALQGTGARAATLGTGKTAALCGPDSSGPSSLHCGSFLPAGGMRDPREPLGFRPRPAAPEHVGQLCASCPLRACEVSLVSAVILRVVKGRKWNQGDRN